MIKNNKTAIGTITADTLGDGKSAVSYFKYEGIFILNSSTSSLGNNNLLPKHFAKKSGTKNCPIKSDAKRKIKAYLANGSKKRSITNKPPKKYTIMTM